MITLSLAMFFVLAVAAICALIRAYVQAPEGYETEHGFYRGSLPNSSQSETSGDLVELKAPSERAA